VVPRIQGGGVGVGLVGDEHLEAVAGVVGEAQLVRRAGVGPLAAADRPGPNRPALAGKVQAGKLRDPRATAPATMLVKGRHPAAVIAVAGGGWDCQDRGLDVGLDREPDRERELAADDVVHEGVGGAGGVGADQDRLGSGLLRQGQQGHRQHTNMVSRGVGAGVARPQDPRQRLPGPIAAVQPGTQRVEPEAVLERAGRALLVAVGLQQGRVNIDAQRPHRPSARRPRPLAGPRHRRPQRRHPFGVGSNLVDNPPRGRRRADPPEQPRLVPQARQVAHTVAPIGKHDDQIPQDRAAVIGVTAARAGKATVGAAAKLAGQPEPVGQLGQQHHPGMAADAVRVGGGFESRAGVGSLHRQGDPPGRECDS
jgi:hypothetical protein